MCSDVGNVFPNAPTKEKVYAIAGEEFGERQGRVVEITRSLHGASTALDLFRHV